MTSSFLQRTDQHAVPRRLGDTSFFTKDAIGPGKRRKGPDADAAAQDTAEELARVRARTRNRPRVAAPVPTAAMGSGFELLRRPGAWSTYGTVAKPSNDPATTTGIPVGETLVSQYHSKKIVEARRQKRLGPWPAFKAELPQGTTPEDLAYQAAMYGTRAPVAQACPLPLFAPSPPSGLPAQPSGGAEGAEVALQVPGPCGYVAPQVPAEPAVAVPTLSADTFPVQSGGLPVSPSEAAGAAAQATSGAPQLMPPAHMASSRPLSDSTARGLHDEQHVDAAQSVAQPAQSALQASCSADAQQAHAPRSTAANDRILAAIANARSQQQGLLRPCSSLRQALGKGQRKGSSAAGLTKADAAAAQQQWSQGALQPGAFGQAQHFAPAASNVCGTAPEPQALRHMADEPAGLQLPSGGGAMVRQSSIGDSRAPDVAHARRALGESSAPQHGMKAQGSLNSPGAFAAPWHQPQQLALGRPGRSSAVVDPQGAFVLPSQFQHAAGGSALTQHMQPAALPAVESDEQKRKRLDTSCGHVKRHITLLSSAAPAQVSEAICSLRQLVEDLAAELPGSSVMRDDVSGFKAPEQLPRGPAPSANNSSAAGTGVLASVHARGFILVRAADACMARRSAELAFASVHRGSDAGLGAIAAAASARRVRVRKGMGVATGGLNTLDGASASDIDYALRHASTAGFLVPDTTGALQQLLECERTDIARLREDLTACAQSPWASAKGALICYEQQINDLQKHADAARITLASSEDTADLVRPTPATEQSGGTIAAQTKGAQSSSAARVGSQLQPHSPGPKGDDMQSPQGASAHSNATAPVEYDEHTLAQLLEGKRVPTASTTLPLQQQDGGVVPQAVAAAHQQQQQHRVHVSQGGMPGATAFAPCPSAPHPAPHFAAQPAEQHRHAPQRNSHFLLGINAATGYDPGTWGQLHMQHVPRNPQSVSPQL